MNPSPTGPRIRWWPAIVIFIGCVIAFVILTHRSAEQLQLRRIYQQGMGLLLIFLLVNWWMFGARASGRSRLIVLGLFLGSIGLLCALFRVRGYTGDFVPVVEYRWKSKPTLVLEKAEPHAALDHSGRPDFPQFLGPHRNGIIDQGPTLARDWKATPPQILWRQPIGPAWSGFAIVGNRAVTFEQRGEQEVVICLDVLTGKLLWDHADNSRYANPIGGEGCRSTPTIHEGRVFTFGVNGIVNCLDLVTGKLLWQRTMAKDAPKGKPEWGYAGSPLIHGEKVVISAGQSHDKSLFAYRQSDGEVVWRGGSQPAEYSSPAFMTLAGVPQIVSFNMLFITSHDPDTGDVLWEYPWGIRQPCMAQPLAVGPDLVVFSSGYGVGCELLKIQKDAEGKLSAERVWKSMNMKSKMASFFHRDGCLYGLDDGILACVDVRDGKRKWKDGRYGHGQLLFVGDLLLVTAENGEIVLLAPTTEGPNELGTFPVFNGKTWNPPALSGDILLMRTDQEVACIRLPTVAKAK